MKISFTDAWQKWPHKTAVLTGLLAAIIITVGSIFTVNLRKTEDPAADTKQLQQVEVMTVSEIQKSGDLVRTAVVEPSQSAPLVARVSGRVTDISASVGDSVFSGQKVGLIDGGNEANPTAVQVRSSDRVLSLFGLIERQALISADNAVAIANQTLQATEANRSVGLRSQQKTIEIVGNAVDQAQLSVRSAKETELEATIDAANLGVEAARLARDQAIIQSQLNLRASSDSVAQASLNLSNAKAAQERTRAELGSQKAQLQGQLDVVREQLRLQEITSGTDGTISRLAVSVGDFVQPGQILGDVIVPRSAKLTVFVPEGIQRAARQGQAVPVTVGSDNLTGAITSVANVSTVAGLYQLEIAIENGVPPGAFGKIGEITFAVSGQTSSLLIPLDSVVVRTDGPIIFKHVDKRAKSIPVNIIAYHNNYAEIDSPTSIAPTDNIIISNTRLLRDGQIVTVN